jgi:hypothetical membrane protein
MNKTRVGAYLWILCLQYFVAEGICIFAWTGHYSLRSNYISDLGAIGCGDVATGLTRGIETVCSPLHAVMNASFLLQGLLIVCGTALVWQVFPKGIFFVVAPLLIGASGVGVFVVGLAPEDTAPGLHFLGAIENFICCNAGMAVMGFAMLRRQDTLRRLGLITLAAGVVGLTAIGFLASGVFLGLGVGGMERLVAYPFPLWLAGMGVLLMHASQNFWPRGPNPPANATMM